MNTQSNKAIIFTTLREDSVFAAIIALCVLAVVSSLDGSLTLLSISPPTDADKIDAWLVFLLKCLPLLLVTCLLQMLLVKALYGMVASVFKAHEHKRKGKGWMFFWGYVISLCWLIVYAFIMLLSVFFSYQFYYRIASAEVFAKNTYVQAVEQVVNNAENFGRQFQDARKQLEELATTSTELKRTENQTGGSCGQKAMRGCGNICSLRETEAANFALHSTALNTLSDKLRLILGEIRLAGKNFDSHQFDQAREKLKTLLGDANHLLESDGIIAALQTELTQRENRQSLTAVRQRPDGSRISLNGLDCSAENPSKILPVIKKVQQSLANIKRIEMPALFNANDDRAVLTRAWECT